MVIAIWAVIKHQEYVFSIFFCALACYTAGALTGFLFGIPRVLQKPARSGTTQSGAATGAPAVPPTYELLIITNLDDVSDWLTKIVVGVGLVELRKIPGTIYHYSVLIAGSDQQVAPLISAVIVYFTVLGFMTGYLTTRMFFERAFRIADLAAEGTDVREITRSKVVETATQTISAGIGRS